MCSSAWALGDQALEVVGVVARVERVPSPCLDGRAVCAALLGWAASLLAVVGLTLAAVGAAAARAERAGRVGCVAVTVLDAECDVVTGKEKLAGLMTAMRGGRAGRRCIVVPACALVWTDGGLLVDRPGRWSRGPL